MRNEKLYRKARRLSGLARFERETTRKTGMRDELRLAWKVPGTFEAGEHAMKQSECGRIYERLVKESK